MDAQKVKQSMMMEYGIAINAITICAQNVWNDCQQPNIVFRSFSKNSNIPNLRVSNIKSKISATIFLFYNSRVTLRIYQF
jgi:hypothetical protein